MVMYVAVVLMNTPAVFEIMMDKHQNFKTKPVWHVLFSTPGIFQLLRDSSINHKGSAGAPPTSLLAAESFQERQKFDELVLKVALERDLLFVTEIILERSLITPQLISLLMHD